MSRMSIGTIAVIAKTTAAAADDPPFREPIASRPSSPTILTQVVRGNPTVLTWLRRGRQTILVQVLRARQTIGSLRLALRTHWRRSPMRSDASRRHRMSRR